MRYMLMRKADEATEAGEPPDPAVLDAMADYNKRLAEGGEIDMPFAETFCAGVRHAHRPLRCALDDRRPGRPLSDERREALTMRGAAS